MPPLKVLLLGANGQLGTDLVKTNPGCALAAATRLDADVTDAAALAILVQKHRPDWIVNTTAFNRTEECEDNIEAAFAVNAFGARNAARACAATGARLLHVSTDFVFDGEKNAPYLESDAARPLSVYGVSKFAGEHFALAASRDNLVVRGASLFGAAGSSGKGGNFVEAVLKKARAGSTVSVIEDIVMSPTYTRDMAGRVWALITRKAPGGIYHATNAGACSWFDFAAEAFRLMSLPPPQKTSASAYPSKMNRARYTALATEKDLALGLPPMRPWPEALRAYLTEKGHLTA